jgi:hypothetical protein
MRSHPNKVAPQKPTSLNLISSLNKAPLLKYFNYLQIPRMLSSIFDPINGIDILMINLMYIHGG